MQSTFEPDDAAACYRADYLPFQSIYQSTHTPLDGAEVGAVWPRTRQILGQHVKTAALQLDGEKRLCVD